MAAVQIKITKGKRGQYRWTLLDADTGRTAAVSPIGDAHATSDAAEASARKFLAAAAPPRRPRREDLDRIAALEAARDRVSTERRHWKRMAAAGLAVALVELCVIAAQVAS